MRKHFHCSKKCWVYVLHKEDTCIWREQSGGMFCPLVPPVWWLPQSLLWFLVSDLICGFMRVWASMTVTFSWHLLGTVSNQARWRLLAFGYLDCDIQISQSHEVAPWERVVEEWAFVHNDLVQDSSTSRLVGEPHLLLFYWHKQQIGYGTWTRERQKHTHKTRWVVSQSC
jgi:hypothetical protein